MFGPVLVLLYTLFSLFVSSPDGTQTSNLDDGQPLIILDDDTNCSDC